MMASELEHLGEGILPGHTTSFYSELRKASDKDSDSKP